MNRCLNGYFDAFSRPQLKRIAKIADLFALDSRDILHRLNRSTKDRPYRVASALRLVVPEALRSDMLHFAHEDYQGEHQGITRTYERLHR